MTGPTGPDLDNDVLSKALISVMLKFITRTVIRPGVKLTAVAHIKAAGMIVEAPFIFSPKLQSAVSLMLQNQAAGLPRWKMQS